MIGEVDTVADAVWRLLLFWWIRNLLPTAKGWMDRILETGAELNDRTRAIAITFSSWVSLTHPGTEVDTAPLERGRGAVPRRRTTGSVRRRRRPYEHRVRHVVDPRPRPRRGAAAARLRARHAERRCDVQRAVPRPARQHRAPPRPAGRGAPHVRRGHRRRGAHRRPLRRDDRAHERRMGAARARRPDPELFARHLELTVQLGNEEGVGHALEGLAACAIATGDIERAGILLGAVDTARTRTGQVDQRTYPTSGPFVERVLASAAASEFEDGRDARPRDDAPGGIAVRPRTGERPGGRTRLTDARTKRMPRGRRPRDIRRSRPATSACRRS